MAELAEEALAPPAAPEADAAESPQAQEPAGSVEQDQSDEEYDEGACDRRQAPPPHRRRPPADRFRFARSLPDCLARPPCRTALKRSHQQSVETAESSAEEQSAEEDEQESSGDEDEKQPLSQRSAYASKHPLPQPTAPKRTRTNRFPKIPK